MIVRTICFFYLLRNKQNYNIRLLVAPFIALERKLKVYEMLMCVSGYLFFIFLCYLPRCHSIFPLSLLDENNLSNAIS